MPATPTVNAILDPHASAFDEGFWAALPVGILIGLLAATCIAALVAVWAYWRFILLERRTAEAERFAELGQLTSGLAHEIKNPLSTIGLNLQLLDEELDEIPHVPPRSHKRLNTVRTEAIRLRETLDDFLRYAGRVEIEPQKTDLGQLVEDVADFFGPQAAAQGVRLTVNRPDVPMYALVDEKLMKQAVLNLALNAVQHMPSGGKLELAARALGRSLELRVADTGAGIDSADQGKVFDAYYSRRKGGTGLGLAMVRRIAESHGGGVALESEPGVGSTFIIRLPT